LIPIRKAFALQKGKSTSTRTSKNDSNISDKLSSESFKYLQQSNSAKNRNESDIEVDADDLFDDKASSGSEASDSGSSEITEEKNLGRYIFKLISALLIL
jgi:hypothetical protein